LFRKPVPTPHQVRGRLFRGHAPATAFATLCAALGASPAAAHAIAERYDLPVPLGYFVAGSAAVVAVTFAITALFVLAAPHRREEKHVRPPGALCPLAHSVRGYGVAVFLLVIAAGLFGHEHPARNIAPTLVWVGWWVGFGFLCAFVTNLWPLLNPWRTLFYLFERMRRRGGVPKPRRAYPPGWREWPAVIFLLAFVWFEMVSPFASKPFVLACVIVAYSAVTFAGMAMYGREAWLNRAEAFTVMFSILGRFAPLRIEGAERKGGTVALRFWGSGLLKDDPPSGAVVAFVLLLLSAVLFDGLLGTGFWRWFEPKLPGDRAGNTAATIGLVGVWLVFLGAYLATCAAMSLASERRGTMWFARVYLFTLVPIAIGYNLAHNFSYLLIQGQEIYRLASDPFGLGWNLIGSAGTTTNVDVVDARTTWYVAIGAIVGGHIIAVWLAHVIALRTAPTRALALRALLPMTVLMVIYTGLSLAILADPLVRFREPDPGYSRVEPLRSAHS
jgi:hypothetical protein